MNGRLSTPAAGTISTAYAVELQNLSSPPGPFPLRLPPAQRQPTSGGHLRRLSRGLVACRPRPLGRPPRFEPVDRVSNTTSRRHQGTRGLPTALESRSDRRAKPLTIVQAFRDHLTYLERSAPPPELLPERLAACCFEVLPIAAAAISILTSDGFRFPVGASCPRVAYAERLHFTTGEGPALDARRDATRVVGDERTVSQCWPQFHAALVRDTPYRAVAAFPITSAGMVWATVDLYLTSDEALRRLPIPDAEAIADLIGSLLSVAKGHVDTWADAPVSAARHITLTAVSLLATSAEMTTAESLAALRERAAAAGMTVDALADAVVRQRLPLRDEPPAAAPAPHCAARGLKSHELRPAPTDPPPGRPASKVIHADKLPHNGRPWGGR